MTGATADLVTAPFAELVEPVVLWYLSNRDCVWEKVAICCPVDGQVDPRLGLYLLARLLLRLFLGVGLS